MIFAEQKKIDDIYSMIRDYRKLLILGCGTCTTVCMSGGEEEADILASKINIKFPDIQIKTITIKRQCDKEFIEEIQEEVQDRDAVLSLACGAGVQMVAEIFDHLPVLPGLNSKFLGTNEGEATWQQRCSLCGNCLLDKTGGICPLTMCPKGLLNGPCGGTSEGKCEVNPQNECVWMSIYKRLEKQNKQDQLYTIFPMKSYQHTHSPQQVTNAKKDLE